MQLNEETITISLAEYKKLTRKKEKKEEQKKKSLENQGKKVKLKKEKELQAQERNKLNKRIHEEKKRELANERAERLRINATESEKKFKIYLKLLGYKYSFQYPVYPNNSFFIVDFFLPKERLVIEIDGGYHKDYKQKAKDKLRDQIIYKECGFRTIRITNEEVYSRGETYFKELLKSVTK